MSIPMIVYYAALGYALLALSSMFVYSCWLRRQERERVIRTRLGLKD